MRIQRPIVYIMQEIAEAVSAKLLPTLSALDTNITGVWYDHGHPQEIIETLQEKDEVPATRKARYPLIALFQDFPIDRGETVGMDGDTTLHMIVAMCTEPDYKAATRQSKNFDPILYPIYSELMTQIDKSKYFMTKGAELIQHTQIDRMYWGKEGLYGNDGNVFNDRIDCIEIQNLKLKINRKLC